MHSTRLPFMKIMKTYTNTQHSVFRDNINLIKINLVHETDIFGEKKETDIERENIHISQRAQLFVSQQKLSFNLFNLLHGNESPLKIFDFGKLKLK